MNKVFLLFFQDIVIFGRPKGHGRPDVSCLLFWPKAGRWANFKTRSEILSKKTLTDPDVFTVCDLFHVHTHNQQFTNYGEVYLEIPDWLDKQF